MKNLAFISSLLLGIFFVTSFSSCKKYEKYDNMEVVENDFSGNVDITSTGTDPAGDFTGDGDSGTYSFAWNNPNEVASATFDITTSSGSVQMIINDAKGTEVLNVTRTADDEDSFSGPTDEGVSGNWLITIILTDFDGDGSFSVHPKK